MSWKRLGVLIQPGSAPWMVSHAAIPFAEHQGGDHYRIYFSSRDERSRSHTGFAELDITRPFDSLRVNPTTVLDPGERGMVDESGAMGGWIIERDGAKYMYYTGWALGVTVPFYWSAGVAVSTDGGLSFERVTTGYSIPRDNVDPLFATNPCVLVDGDLLRTYYVSGVRWVIENGELKHYYHLKYDESDDFGATWKRTGHAAIDFASPLEYAIARPAVYKRDDGYEMWYCFRAQPGIDTYRIGYAVSDDGVHFERRDAEAGIDVADEGFDSDMIEYPFVFDHGSDRYLLYNGNGYGQTGIGLAVWEA